MAVVASRHELFGRPGLATQDALRDGFALAGDGQRLADAQIGQEIARQRLAIRTAEASDRGLR